MHLGESKQKQQRRAAAEAAREEGGGDAEGSMPIGGIATIARAHKRGIRMEGEEEPEDEPQKRNRKKKEEIVTVTRRQVSGPDFRLELVRSCGLTPACESSGCGTSQQAGHHDEGDLPQRVLESIALCIRPALVVCLASGFHL